MVSNSHCSGRKAGREEKKQNPKQKPKAKFQRDLNQPSPPPKLKRDRKTRRCERVRPVLFLFFFFGVSFVEPPAKRTFEVCLLISQKTKYGNKLQNNFKKGKGGFISRCIFLFFVFFCFFSLLCSVEEEGHAHFVVRGKGKHKISDERSFGNGFLYSGRRRGSLVDGGDDADFSASGIGRRSSRLRCGEFTLV
jgi:hypothetical protein